jgi:hypothetical protein
MKNFNGSLRAKTGIIALILCALFSSARLLYKQIVSFNFESIGRDFISLKEKRYEELKKALPSHGVVGYLSDVYSENIFDNNAEMADYFSAQYILAPVVVAHSSDKDLVIGDFFYKNYSKLYKEKKLVQLKDFKNGLMLLQREIK